MFKTIVSAVDGSECATRALEAAISLAKSERSRIYVCSVVDPVVLTEGMPPGTIADDVVEDARTAAEETVAKAVERVRQAGIEVSGDVLLGEPAYEIVEYAKKLAADGVIMGTHGRSGLKRLFMGSVAESVLRTAPCPIMIVRDGTIGVAASPSKA